jgi:hypothetical protein
MSAHSTDRAGDISRASSQRLTADRGDTLSDLLGDPGSERSRWPGLDPQPLAPRGNADQ